MAIGTEEIIGPAQTTLNNLVNSSVNFLPNLIAAAITLVIGVVLAELAEKVTKRVLVKAKIDSWAKKSGIEKAVFHLKISGTLAAAVKWYLLLIFFSQIAISLNLGALSTFINAFLLAIPSILVGIVILMIGLLLGNFLSENIKQKGFAFYELISAGVYFVVVYFSAVLALPKFGITNTEILVNAFNYIIAGISVGISIAIGLGMGLALKDPIQDLVSPKKKR